MIVVERAGIISVLEMQRDLNVARGNAQLFSTEDCFWTVSTDQKFRLTERPNEFTIGQLVDSAQFLLRVTDADFASGRTSFGSVT